MVCLLLSASGSPPTLAMPRDSRVGDIVISHPHAPPTRDGQPNGAVYFHHIENLGSQDDILVSATTRRARRMEVHEMSMDNNTMRMREISGIALPAKTRVALMRGAPGGFHLMVLGLDKPLLVGETFEVILRFRQAGDIAVKVEVETTKAATKATADKHHHHGHGSRDTTTR
jgi:copper(I)-binding protein